MKQLNLNGHAGYDARNVGSCDSSIQWVNKVFEAICKGQSEAAGTLARIAVTTAKLERENSIRVRRGIHLVEYSVDAGKTYQLSPFSWLDAGCNLYSAWTLVRKWLRDEMEVF